MPTLPNSIARISAAALRIVSRLRAPAAFSRARVVSRHRQAAFSLLEVLVVVAIIALLAAVLLPSLSASRQRAAAVACLANMRQMGLALHMYAQNHRGRLVSGGLSHGGAPTTPALEARSWFHTMNREYRDRLVARCQGDRSPYWTTPLSGTEPPSFRRVSYAVNDYLTGDVPGWEEYNLMQRVRRPATTVVFAELAGDTPWAVGDHFHVELWLLNPRYEAGLQMGLDRHLGKANYTFVDGHAATHVFESTYRVRDIQRVNGQLVPDWGHNLYDPKVGN